MRPLPTILAALAIVAVLVFGIGIGFGVLAQRISQGFNGTIALGCATLIATTVLGLWQFDRTKRKEAEARIFALRAPVYERLISILRDLMFATKGWAKARKPDELAKELATVTYDMTVWGGQDTVRALMKFSEMPAGDAAAMFRVMETLFKAIRTDLGHNDDSTLSIDLVVQMITAEERDDVRRILGAR